MRITLTLLEKSKKLPVGWRSIHGTGDQMHWSIKKGDGTWAYGGLVSPKERVEEEKKLKAKATARALRSKSKKKTTAVLEKVEADKQAGIKAQGSTVSDKPSQAELDKMPKKQQLYYDDTTSDRARDLCDKTGLLCIDKTAEDYLESNLNTVFKLNKEQKHLVDGLDVMTPAGTDMKWLKDSVFVADTLEKLKEQKLMWDTLKKKGKWSELALGANPTLSTSQAIDLLVESYDDLNDMIENLEKEEHDKIILSKMRSLEKGMRGFKTIDGLPAELMKVMFPEPYNVLGSTWGSHDSASKEILNLLGITNEEQYRHFMAKNQSNDLWALAGLSLMKDGDKAIKYYAEGKNGINSEYRYYKNGIGYVDVGERLPGDKGYLDPEKMTALGDMLKKKYSAITDLYSKLFEFTNPDGIDDVSGLKYADSFKEVISNLGSQYSHTKSDTAISTNPDLTWRDLGTSIKSVMRAKNVDWSKSEEMLATITDTAKVMGTTPIRDSQKRAVSKMDSFHDALSPAMKLNVQVKDSMFQQFAGYMTGSSGDVHSVTYTEGVPDSGFIGYVSATITKDRTVAKRYYHPRTVPGDIKRSQYTTAEKFGATKQLNSAIRLKGLRMSAVSTMQTATKSIGQTSHTGVSIAIAIGANWQNRELSKKTGIIPAWEWGGARPLMKNAVIPANSKQAIQISSRSGGSGYGTHHVSSDEYSKIVMDIRQAGIIKHLGLTSGVKTTGQKQVPKLVLRTNTDGASGWQKKVDNEWTHEDSRVVNGRWQKGAIKVNNVFDLMYHDYFGDYKKVEATKGNVMYGWHGTNFEAGQSIIKTGYDRGSGLLGNGQYIAKSSSKAAAYLGGGAGNWSHHVGTRGVLTWNRVAMGKVNSDQVDIYSAAQDSQYDTVFGSGLTGGGANNSSSYGQLQHDEWCVKNFKAVVPLQWVDVTIIQAPH